MNYFIKNAKVLVVASMLSMSLVGVAYATNDSTSVSVPSCPFSAQEGRTVIKFNTTNKIVSDGTQSAAKTAAVSTSIPAGHYNVNLFSFDGYEGRQSVTQPKESWFAVFKKGNTEVAHSSSISDLADKVKSATRTQTVDTSLYLASSVNSVLAYHAAYPNKSNPNSVIPVCLALDKIPETPVSVPACPFKAQAGRTIVNFTPSKKIWSNTTEAEAKTDAISTTLPAGKYTVNLFSFDGYEGRQDVTQPKEQWFAILKKGNTEVTHTSAISDLADKVKSATVTETVDTILDVPAAVNSVVAYHAAYPNTKSANSVTPVCASFDKVPEPPPPPLTFGSIAICKAVVDSNGQSSDGSAFSSSTFSVAGIDFAGNAAAPHAEAVLPTATFTTPLTLNVDLFGNDGVNDAQCIKYDNLELGSYYYGTEQVTGSGWLTPKYNDQHTITIHNVGDFFNYSGELFTSGGSDDASRDMNADGHITLSESRPDRTLVILNKHEVVHVNAKPVITVLGANPMQITVGTDFVDPGATASDPEDGNITEDIVVGGDTVATTTPGTYTIKYNVTDSNGAAADQKTRTVEVAVGGGGEDHPQCSDTEDNDADGLTDIADPACHTDGNAGNPDTYNPSGDDENSKPTITVVGNNPFSVAADVTFTDPGATAFDQEDGNITANIVVGGDTVATTTGSYTITYNVTDSKGVHADEKTRVVNVTGGQGGGTESPECSDGEDNDLDGGADEVDAACHTDGDTDNPDSYDPTLDDENSKPVITLVGAAVVELNLGDNFTDPGATAFDLEDGDITANIVVGGDTVATSTVGTYNITYNVDDSKGAHAVEKTRTLQISEETGGGGGNPQCSDDLDNDIDGATDEADPACHTDGRADNPDTYTPEVNDENSKPIITLVGEGSITITVGTTFTDPGATASDPEDGNITEDIVVSGDTVATSTVGTYTIKYNVTDSKGAAAPEVTRTVIVQAAGGTGGDTGTPTGGGGGGGGGGGNGPIPSGGGNGPVALTTPVTTTTETTPLECTEYLRAYIKLGADNDATEVRKLQAFLQSFEGFTDLAIDGVYKQVDFDAVSVFQKRYFNEVLTPWGYDDSTGYVYYTTRKKVNEIYCNKAFPLNGVQLAEVEAFRAFLENLRNAGVPTEGLGTGEGALATTTPVVATTTPVVTSTSTTVVASNTIGNKISQQFARAFDALSGLLSDKTVIGAIVLFIAIIAGIIFYNRRAKVAGKTIPPKK